MMALAHKQCPDNVEGCRQRMQRALAQGQVRSTEVFERRHQHTTNQHAKLNALGMYDTESAFPSSARNWNQFSGALQKSHTENGTVPLLGTMDAIHLRTKQSGNARACLLLRTAF
ncbi:MAG: hypothetical protein KTR25_01995 [Myxococcales bacterium]|nr:hypothetical protein [Myxococcales bacterium]